MMERIVVGIDGSAGSLRALAWAVEEAKATGATLEAVSVWHPPFVDAYSPTYNGVELEAAAQATLDEAVGPFRSAVKIETRVGCGAPAWVLIDAAKNADLLVVGSRGHGGFAGLLLGSVSQQVSHHSPCPVVIVPDPD